MTSHYLDLEVRQDPETAPHHIMSNLFGRLHRALVQLSAQDIGASFPRHDNHKPALGRHMRLHGPANSLNGLIETDWLRGLTDYVRVSDIQEVPKDTRYRLVSRMQVKSNVERLRRRAMKRHGWDEKAASERIPASVEQRLKLPFLTLSSASTSQSSFRLFVQHGPLLDEPEQGSFSSYGLGQTATIPWF